MNLSDEFEVIGNNIPNLIVLTAFCGMFIYLYQLGKAKVRRGEKYHHINKIVNNTKVNYRPPIKILTQT